WALSHIAMLDQHDRKVWNLLLDHQLEVGNWEEARKVGESALFVDVKNWKTHRLYARALARTGSFVSAVFELNSALVCHPKPTDGGETEGELGRANKSQKERERAAKAGESKKKIEPAPAPAPRPGPDKELRHHHKSDPQGT